MQPNHILYASPLYILREQCTHDLFDVLEHLKSIGYDGVEFLGLFGHQPEEIKHYMEKLGMHVLGDHVPYSEFVLDPQTIVDIHKRMGCQYLSLGGVCGNYGPTGNQFKETLANITKIGSLCRAAGITLLYHNHDDEIIECKDGKQSLDLLMEEVEADVLSLEPDLGWISIAGGNPLYYLEKYAHRIPILHLKDYYASDSSKIGRIRGLNGQRGGAEHADFEFRPTGYGIMNHPAIWDACMATNANWIVADHDLSYERDPLYDLKLSLDYLRTLAGL